VVEARPDRRPRNISDRALGRPHGRPAVARGDWISDGAGPFPIGFPSPPASLVFLLSWWDSHFLNEFGAATLAIAGWVSARVYWAGRRPSSSPCDRINYVLDEDSPLGFAVILSPVGEGWAVGCCPGQFLRQTELIKRSLWLDDEPTWWCLEPKPERKRIVIIPRAPMGFLLASAMWGRWGRRCKCCSHPLGRPSRRNFDGPGPASIIGGMSLMRAPSKPRAAGMMYCHDTGGRKRWARTQGHCGFGSVRDGRSTSGALGVRFPVLAGRALWPPHSILAVRLPLWSRRPGHT